MVDQGAVSGAAGRQPLFLLLVGLIGAFLFIRLSTRLIRRGTRWWPGNVRPGGLHIHHVVFGQAMVLAGGIGSFAPHGDAPAARNAFGLLFGIGCGLVLDEFALVLHLKDVYWSEEGRQSVDAVILSVAVIGLLLLGVTPLGATSGPPTSRIVAITVLLVLVVVSLLKGKVWTGLFGLFLVFLPLVGAVRLARPNSPWARWRYASRPRRLARAERREERIRGRLETARRRVYDVIAGAPSVRGPAPRRAPPPVRPARKAGGPPPADLGPSRTGRALRPLRKPCLTAVVWYLRLAATLDAAFGVAALLLDRPHRLGGGWFPRSFLVTPGFTAAVLAALLAVVLRRRKRAAWVVTFAAASGYAAAYWLGPRSPAGPGGRPADWVWAGLSSAVALALWTARPVCRVRGQSGNVRLGLGYLVFGGIALVGIGTALARVTGAPPTPSWPESLRYALVRVVTLARPSGPPRVVVPDWADAVVNVLGVLLLLQVLRALFRSPAGGARSRPWDESRLRFLLGVFGGEDSLGYFALRGDTSAAWSPDREAAVVHRVAHGVALAGGDPVGDPAAWPDAVDDWLRAVRARAWVPAVVCAGRDAADLYGRRGLRTLAFGDEAVVGAAGFRLEEAGLRRVRRTRDALRAAGYRVVVRRRRAVPRAEADRLARLADAWRRGAADRGLGMSLAGLGGRADGDCVLVECRDLHDRTCALLSLVPWGATGLTLDLMRREAESSDGLFLYMLAELLLRARADAAPVSGVDRVGLNVHVLHAAVRTARDPGTGRVRQLHRLVVETASRKRRLAAAHQVVSAFRPHWRPRFVLYERATELPRIALAVADADGLLVARRLTRPDPR